MLTGGPAPQPRHGTIPLALQAAAQSESGVTFLDAEESERALTFREMHERARRAAGTLLARGIRPGDRVAIVLPTCPEFMDAFFGALYAGAIPVPLYPPVRLGRLEEFHARTARLLPTTRAPLVVNAAPLP